MNKYIFCLFFIFYLCSLPVVVLAKPFSGYCLDNYSPEVEKKEKSKAVLERRNPRIDFSHRGKPFHMEAAGTNGLTIYTDKGEPVSIAPTNYSDFGGIREITLSKSDWVWISGVEKNYVVKIDREGVEPKFSLPIEISGLRVSQCSYFTELLLGDCSAAKGFYSPVLDSFFFTGYRPNVFGDSPIETVEVENGLPKEVFPAIWSGSVIESNKLGGLIYNGYSQGVFFYDGKKTYPLSGYIYQKDTHLIGDSFDAQETLIGNRYFLSSGYRMRLAKKEFIYEVLPGPRVVPLSTKNIDMGTTLFEIFIVPGIDQVMAISNVGIYIYENNKFSKIISAKNPTQISHNYNTVWQNPDGSIVFGVIESGIEVAKSFILYRASQKEDCGYPDESEKYLEYIYHD